MIKLSFKLAALLLGIVATSVILQQGQLAVLALGQIDPLPKTRALIVKEQYAQAFDYLSFFMDYDYVSESFEARALYREIADKRGRWQYQARKLVEGLLEGTSDETIGQLAGVGTDFFFIGDLRDLAKQGVSLARGEEVDKVLAGLATLGLIATGAQIASGGATIATGGTVAPAVAGATAAKSGLVVLKVARKLGKLPSWLGKAIIKSVKTVKSERTFGPLLAIFDNVNSLAKTRGGLSLLSKTRDARSLAHMATFAEVFGENSVTLYRIGGNTVVDISQRVGKIGKDTIKLATTYGKAGLRVLDRFGAINFVKYSSRASKMVYKGDLIRLIARFLLLLPTWALYLLITFSAVIWLPFDKLTTLKGSVSNAG